MDRGKQHKVKGLLLGRREEMSKGIEAVKEYSKERETAKGVCDRYLEDLTMKKPEHRARVEFWLKEYTGSKYPYYDLYRGKIKQGKMIEEYYGGITKSRVDAEFIVKHGRELGDGFVGMGIKNQSYSDYYIVALYDGANGVLFQKTYKGYPSKEDILMDSIFNLDNRAVKKEDMLKTVRGLVEESRREPIMGRAEYLELIETEGMRGYLVGVRRTMEGVPRGQRKDYLRSQLKTIHGLQEGSIRERPMGFTVRTLESEIRVEIFKRRGEYEIVKTERS